MAIITFGPTITDARNKCGGIVFSRTRGGAMIRTWLKPHNPQSALQQWFRKSVTKVVGSGWPALTEDQRLQWITKAATLRGRNTLGGTFPRAGQDLYQQRNCDALIAGGSAITSVPTDVTPVGPGTLTLAASSSTQTLTLTPTTALPGGYGVVIRATKQMSPGIYNFTKWLRSLILPSGVIASGFGTGTAPVPPFTAGNNYTAADWAVAAGTLTVTPSLPHEDIYVPALLTDSTTNATITIPNATDLYVVMSARLNPSTGAAYVILLNPTGNFWGIYYRPGWPESGLANINVASYSAWTTTPTTLQFNLTGTTLTATYAGTSVCTGTDSTLTSGATGLIAYAPSHSLQSWALTNLAAVRPTIAGLTATYLAKYGALVPGKKIGLTLSYVNLTTGQQLEPQSVITTIA